MNGIKLFHSPEFGEVRTIKIKGEPWFVGKDVAEILGYTNTNKAIQVHVDEEDKFLRSAKGTELGKLFSSIKEMQEKLGRQDNWFINESGLYSLILSSKLESAKRFKRWITSEVLPAIRKTGGYLTPEKVEEALLNPDTIIKLATQLKQERQARLTAEQQVEEAKPKVIFADAVSASNTSILIGELSKILRGNGVEIGQRWMFEWLRSHGYLIKRHGTEYNMPTQKAMELGLFEIREGSYVNGSGVNIITKTPKVTGKGQQYFINKFLLR